jgi:hypothetical protein
MDESVVYLGHRDRCLAGDELHGESFGQVSALSCLDANIRYVKKADLFSPESSQELVVRCFDKHNGECSDYASWNWGRRRRRHLHVIHRTGQPGIILYCCPPDEFEKRTKKDEKDSKEPKEARESKL